MEVLGALEYELSSASYLVRAPKSSQAQIYLETYSESYWVSPVCEIQFSSHSFAKGDDVPDRTGKLRKADACFEIRSIVLTRILFVLSKKGLIHLHILAIANNHACLDNFHTASTEDEKSKF